jgi:hypothetical protein
LLQHTDDGKTLLRIEIIVISHEHIKQADKLPSEVRSAYMEWEMTQNPWYAECIFSRFEPNTRRYIDALFDQVRTGYFYVYPHVAHIYFNRPDIYEPQKDGTIMVRGGHLYPGDLIDFYMSYKQKEVDRLG